MVFPNLPWQRCQFHLQHNAQGYVPRVSMRAEVARDLRTVLAATDLAEAQERLHKTVEKYAAVAPALSAWMDTAVPEASQAGGRGLQHGN